MRNNFISLQHILILALLLGLGKSWAQSIPLRLQVSTEYRISSRILDPQTGQVLTGNELGTPTISLMLPGLGQGDLQEVSLLMPTIGQANAMVRTSLGIGYQYNWVATPGWDKLKLYLGAGFKLDYQKFNASVISSINGFQEFNNLSELSTTFRVSPGLIYDFSDRFFLNLSIPLELVQFRFRNPSSPQPNPPLATTEFPLGQSLPIKLGFGVKF